jgi:hypothetical protein
VIDDLQESLNEQIPCQEALAARAIRSAHRTPYPQPVSFESILTDTTQATTSGMVGRRPIAAEAGLFDEDIRLVHADARMA